MVFISVQDLVKKDDEVKRLAKKLVESQDVLDKTEAKMKMKDYENKTPEKLKIENANKISATKESKV